MSHLLLAAIRDCEDIPSWKVLQLLQELQRYRRGCALLSGLLPEDTPEETRKGVLALDLVNLRKEVERELGDITNPMRRTPDDVRRWFRERTCRDNWPGNWNVRIEAHPSSEAGVRAGLPPDQGNIFAHLKAGKKHLAVFSFVVRSWGDLKPLDVVVSPTTAEVP